MDQNNRIMKVFDENGNEREMYILFATSLEEYNKNYIFYVDANDENSEVYVSSFTEDNNLHTVEDEDEWMALEEVFSNYVESMKNNNCQNCSGSCDGDCEGNCDGGCSNCSDCHS